MQYYRCKCGKHEYWGSGMVPAKCEGCEECNTTLEQNPENHRTPEAHDWVTKYDENTGEPYRRCRICYQKEKK